MVKKRPRWTLEQALELVRSLNERLLEVGYVVALTGSVLFKGESNKDLDLLIYPMTTEHQDKTKVAAKLKELGLLQVSRAEQVQERWKKMRGSNDKKHVEIWRTRDRRKIDIFMVS